MRNFTIFKTGSQRGVNTFMSGEGAIEHPMSTHSAPFGTSWKARGWRYIASILMILTLCVGNMWGDINWDNYALDTCGQLENNGKYYILNASTNNFLKDPGSWATASAQRAKYIANGSTAYDQATSFTFLYQNSERDELSDAVKIKGKIWKLSYQDANSTTCYFNDYWGTYKSTEPKDWKTKQQEITIGDSYSGSSYSGFKLYKTNVLYGTKYLRSAATYFSWNNSADNSSPFKFIPEEAYEDATAGTSTDTKTFTGAQYYYTVEAQVYTNGVASSTGGSMKMAPRTYKKPAVADWTYPDDYVDEIDTKVKGGYGDYAVVNIYCKVTPTLGYNFTGFKDASNNALTESTEKGTYTYLPNTYELVEAVNGIYRVSLRVNGADADHPTAYKLRACFVQAAEPVAYAYNANNEKIAEYTNLATAFSSAAAGSRIELRKEITNISSALTIAKSLTLDFNNHTITGTADIMIQITDGNVTFVDNSTSGVGGITTGGATAVSVSGGSLTVKDGKYVAATYAIERTGGSVTIKNGGFESDANPDISGSITLNGGFFYNNGNLDVTSDYAVVTDIPTGMKYTAKDYRYMVVKKTSSNYPRCVVISEKTDMPKDTMRINFNSLEGAIAYVNNNADDDRVKTIIMRENCTLNGGRYTIPQYTTLVIPYSADQSVAHPHVELTKDDNKPEGAYRTLTLQNGAHIDIYGALEIGGKMTGGASAAQGELGIARPSAPRYGLLTMGSGTSITLCDSASLNAWGFVQGAGTIDVRRGATVREMFQINDWKGYSATTAMVRAGAVDYTYKVLPVTQYFIQNVEVKTTYRPGSRLLGQVTVLLEILPNPVGFNDVGIIGVKYSAAEKAAYAEKNPGKELKDDVAVFLMDNEDTSEDTWVCKSYDVANDIQLYEVNNSAHLGSLLMTIDMTDIYSSLYIDADSREFVLPITNNFKIHLLYGNLYVTQDTELLPGAEIEINKKGTLTINQNWDETKQKWIPQTLYLYDKDQWGTFVYKNKEGNDYNFGYASRIRYRHGDVPTVRTLTPEGLGDAKLTVHGTVDVQGYLKTTQGDWSAAPDRIIIGTSTKKYATTCTATELVEKTTGGASITSTIADAGTIILSRNTGNVGTTGVSNYLWQVNSVGDYISGEPDYYGTHIEPALLKNANGTYTNTKNKLAGNSFCYIDFNGVGTWKMLTNDGCFVYDENDVYYAKPKDYVALRNGKTAEDDHTYKSADGSRTFILVDDCQWWEVKPVAGHPDLFECKHPDNRIVYYYDYEASKWKEKRHNVTWLTWEADTIEVYSLKHGVQPKYLGDVPTREGDAYYTYDFIGWSPAITDQTIVTGDVTYTAQYERKDVMYTVTWKDLAGNIIESGYYKLGDAPTCTSEVDMDGKEWSPAVGAVTGNTIYQLQAKEVKANYTITWKNWNGTTLQTTTPAAGTAAADVLAGYTAGTPSKPALDDIEFEFAGWTPTVVDANADAVYTATFTEHLITYAITWKNGEEILLVQNVTPNTVPQYTGATPESAEEGYGFIGWTPAVVAATEDQIYTAQFELQNKKVDGETYAIPSGTQQTLTTVTITDDGKLVIPTTSTLTVYDLILEANSNASGQLDAPANSNIVTVNAYFDWKPNGETGTASRTWYAIAVPWEVDAETGIILKETGRTLRIGVDFDLIYYSGSERASVGNKPSCWKYVQHDANKTMRPGRLYMMYFDPGFKTIRFAKKTGSAVLYTTPINVSLFPESTDNMDKDANWNGIANPRTYYASLSAGTATYAQVLNNGSLDDYFANPGAPVYQTINLASSKFTVGKPLFIQATQATSVVVTKQTTAGIENAAPRRRAAAAAAELPQGIAAVYRLAIAGADQPEADNLFVQVAENEKADRYTIGQDLVKGGVASGRAQVWVNRYDAKLSVNTQALSENEATYPLTIQIPSNGEYTLSIGAVENEDYALYLTRNGEAIWNLSDGAYTGTFEKGTTSEYGLRVSAKSPQIATGLDEAVVDAKGETRKVLINNTVYIIRGENVYSVDGQLVK